VRQELDEFRAVTREILSKAKATALNFGLESVQKCDKLAGLLGAESLGRLEEVCAGELPSDWIGSIALGRVSGPENALRRLAFAHCETAVEQKVQKLLEVHVNTAVEQSLLDY
jgi:hypothetical protein